MSLRLKLILAFAALVGVGFAAFGVAALRITGVAVEREVERRIELTLAAIRDHPRFFISEAQLNREQFAQVAAISGFEIVVPESDGRTLRGSSLPRDVAEEVLEAARGTEEFDREVLGTAYRVVRAESGGKTFYLLSPLGAAARVKAEIRTSILLVAAAAVLVAVLAGYLLAGTITRPLRDLARKASEVRGGRLDVEMPSGGGREVSRLSASFREMLLGLGRYREELVRSERLATLGQFSASVAHELRNPLSSMRMTAEMLLDRVGADERAELAQMLAEMARLDHSIEELLFHAGTPRYVKEDVDLAGVVSDAATTLGPLAEHLEVALEVGESSGPAVCRADGGKVRQAVMNLLLNGIQACEAGGRVTLVVREEEAGVVVEVTDTGPGVPDELRERLFEPFVSGREGGTGLGLAVAKAVAEAHGGAVEHSRREGRTTFRLLLGRHRHSGARAGG
jgi:signal transduction histidine kinase